MPDTRCSVPSLAGHEVPHGRRYESAASWLGSLDVLQCHRARLAAVWMARFGRGSDILGGRASWAWVEHTFVEIDSYAIAWLCSLVEQARLLDGAYSRCEGVRQQNPRVLCIGRDESRLVGFSMFSARCPLHSRLRGKSLRYL